MLGLYLSMPYLSGKLSGHLTLLSDVNRSKARSGITLAIGMTTNHYQELWSGYCVVAM